MTRKRIGLAVSGLMFICAAARAAQSALDCDLEAQSAQAGMTFERMALRASAPEAVLAQAAAAAPSVLKPSAALGEPRASEKKAEGVPAYQPGVMDRIDDAMDALFVKHTWDHGPWLSLGRSLSSLLLAPAAYTLVGAAKSAIKAYGISPALVPFALVYGVAGVAIQGVARGVIGFFMGGVPEHLDPSIDLFGLSDGR